MAPRPRLHGPPGTQDFCSLSGGQDAWASSRLVTLIYH